MPNKPAAKKYLRKSQKRYLKNRAVKKDLRKIVKQTRKLIEAKKTVQAKKNLLKVVKALDKAAQHGVIKKNTASRQKSRLTLALHKIKSSS